QAGGQCPQRSLLADLPLPAGQPTLGFRQRADEQTGRFGEGPLEMCVAELVAHPIPAVDAPWMSVRIAGWPLPLIVDHQGELLKPKLMRTLWSGRAPRR